MTTFVEKRGNLLESGADVLVNATNTQGVMGAGIALQFRERWPEMYADYRYNADRGFLNTECVHIWENPSEGEPRWIVNLHTKDDPRRSSRYLYVASGLISLADSLNGELSEATSVAIPALGCGLGGLAWDPVETMIREALSGDYVELNPDLEVWIYPPQSEHRHMRWSDLMRDRCGICGEMHRTSGCPHSPEPRQ